MAVAVLMMAEPSGVPAFTVTSKVTVVDWPAESVPPTGVPVPAPAPAPNWNWTALPRNSAWSRSTASVFVPALAPAVIRSVPRL